MAKKYHRWTLKDIAFIKTMLANGVKVGVIAGEMNMKRDSITDAISRFKIERPVKKD